MSASKLNPHRPANRRRDTREAFKAQTSFKQSAGNPGAGVEKIYAGIAVAQKDNGAYQIALALHDGTYCLDYDLINVPFDQDNSASSTSSESGSGVATPASLEDIPNDLAKAVLKKLSSFRTTRLSKTMGAGLTEQVAELCPQLAALLWSELDIVPFIFGPNPFSKRDQSSMSVDEEADYMSRKTVKQFDLNGLVPVVCGHRHQVAVDCEGRALITNLESYEDTVRLDTTWAATMKYAESLRRNKTKIAFFNSTPQGGGVALMRHALIRFIRLIGGVDCKWYVPYGKPAVFRITKDNHNILQGVATHGERLTPEKINELDTWVKAEAKQCRWLESGGPLAAREQGGADVIIVDDPQMPSLVKIAKEQDPTRPVIFRSHIQVRADLADQEGTPTAEVWNWVWDNVKDCNVFVSHPVRAFVPKNVTPKKVGYLPATTDWKDGLNKHMKDWDNFYYMHLFGSQCFQAGMRRLAYPNREYIVQIARFDPAKGIPDVIASYAEFRREYMQGKPIEDIPQLCIAGHGAVDDPDAVRIYNETEELLASDKYREIREDVVVMRVGASDQILNALMHSAHVALQLSTREGFEVKVSEALHHGVPIIATRAGGIPLQVQDGKSGFVVEPGDYKAVAKHLRDLFTDQQLYADMAAFAENHISDEVSTVGNALSWLYLADTLAQGEKIEPDSKWINDMAREKAGLPYLPDEVRLPRNAESLNLSQ
ncbi:Nn.00g067380.m01.CDS01 [Neocucurbitaria sp. VM-36]